MNQISPYFGAKNTDFRGSTEDWHLCKPHVVGRVVDRGKALEPEVYGFNPRVEYDNSNTSFYFRHLFS